MEALLDPDVARAKFEREIAQFRELEDIYRERGWWMLRSKFPEVTIAFVNPKLKPASVIFAADINFENYDLWPPSVKLVDPFTRTPYTFGQLPTRLPRKLQNQPVNDVVVQVGFQELMQASNINELPFLCLQGIREYHKNPGHTGDSWLLHRGSGVGTLNYIISQLSKYGMEPINGYEMSMNISISGFAVHPNNIPL